MEYKLPMHMASFAICCRCSCRIAHEGFSVPFFGSKPFKSSLSTKSMTTFPLSSFVNWTAHTQSTLVHSFASKVPDSSSPARPRLQQGFHEDLAPDNIFVYLITSFLRDLRDGLFFLLKQPGEFKYLEFPSIQIAGKMALFTVVVVMVLIVFLATVDSAFSYIVATVLRRIG